MPPANIEDDVASHVLIAVFQQRTVAFVGWALMVPSWGIFLCGNPVQMSVMDVMVGVGVVRQ